MWSAWAWPYSPWKRPRAGGAAQLQQPARAGRRTVPDGQATRLGDPGIATSRSGALRPAFTRTASVTVVLSRARPARVSRGGSGGGRGGADPAPRRGGGGGLGAFAAGSGG